MEEMMPRGEYLGEFEQMVLLAVARLGERGYGMAILEELAQTTGTEVAVGSVYAALDRLERAGFVSSAVGEPTPERGGRAKRFFRLTPGGGEALTRCRRALAALWEGLEVDTEGLS